MNMNIFAACSLCKAVYADVVQSTRPTEGSSAVFCPIVCRISYKKFGVLSGVEPCSTPLGTPIFLSVVYGTKTKCIVKKPFLLQFVRALAIDPFFFSMAIDDYRYFRWNRYFSSKPSKVSIHRKSSTFIEKKTDRWLCMICSRSNYVLTGLMLCF